MLQINNLSKKFGSQQILNNVSCELTRGTIGVILGSSGTGKSTLLRIIAGLESYDKGSITLDEHNLKAQDVGMVFQQFNLFENLTVIQNITFGLCKGRTNMPPAQAHQQAVNLLQRYAMVDLAERFPDELSGGQKQRLAILRTIAQKPTILCFDEPTSALDPLLKTSIAQTITELAQEGYTLVIATHDIDLVEQLNCMIFLMNHGALQEQTRSEDFVLHPDSFPALKKFMYRS